MIREAQKSDLEAILTIYNDAIINTTAVYTYEPTTIEERIQWLENKKQKNEPVFVFEEDNIVQGFATYGSFRDWPAYLYSIEHSIYVHPDYRNSGIASQLLSKLIEEAQQSGYRTIVAGIDASNIGSIKLHEKFNFNHAGTITQVGYKFEQWLDLAFYQLDLYNIK
ncbi:L-amino acid N-acyltransferase [Staphylococcus pasteuri]|uniref:Phosphinothricin acetyltransferase n=2 Tax=Staphylococcus TaxID=1279 RepID=A0ABY1H0F2_9STAP|nr:MULTISPECIES: GNAT family N-acetyltransferase [Staphylococcus]ATH61802.1 phosphinothricin acetyltransferase [Staphylococcus pasteuri]KKI56101.1 Phosphinothricin N-acetyltransferase [Staphylococcus pasteuri]MCF7599973.1 N-acetyltransferase family protein [Staphylococcus pasteuri]MDI3231837.1 N-acetyltransferase family protein [Staphylococcus pasteuri]MDO6572687.1 GNAT family N-acetyltransferase [Staphylococcus pasteuri_A]